VGGGEDSVRNMRVCVREMGNIIGIDKSDILWEWDYITTRVFCSLSYYSTFVPEILLYVQNVQTPYSCMCSSEMKGYHLVLYYQLLCIGSICPQILHCPGCIVVLFGPPY
jgi:hypothetical protein